VEIKYRAWHKADIETGTPSKFVWDSLSSSYFKEMSGTKESYKIDEVFSIPHNWMVEMYTGKDDEDGVEIYVGDIVIKDGKYAEVIFSEKASKFCIRLPSKQWHGIVNKIYSLNKVKVVGNRHENPGLLA